MTDAEDLGKRACANYNKIIADEFEANFGPWADRDLNAISKVRFQDRNRISYEGTCFIEIWDPFFSENPEGEVSITMRYKLPLL